MSTQRYGKVLIAVAAAWAWAASATAQTVIFKDDFESPVSSATYWLETSDNDPTTPVVGPSWAVVEDQVYYVQEVRHPQNLTGGFSYPSFAAASGQQYLHTMQSFDTGGNVGQAWAPISVTDQALMQSATALDLTTKIFGLSGHDGWRGAVRITGYDSAATVGTSPAFDIRLRDGGSGLDGTVQYVDGSGTHTIPGMVFKVNTWQDLTIQADFVSDTFRLALNGADVSGLTWAGGDLSKIQSIVLSLGTTTGEASRRAGFDDFTLVVPEPTSAALLCAASGVLLVLRRRE
jgi:hypothetical protein